MKKVIYSLLIILLIGLFIYIKTISGCSVSDKEAITKTMEFCARVDVGLSKEPWILVPDEARLMFNEEVKVVAFGQKGNTEVEVRINCKLKRVVGFFNWDIRRQIKRKFNIPNVTSEPHNWPPFLSRNKAKDRILSLANKIRLPSDVELHNLSLDKNTGIWSGWWVRKRNGYSYEKDGVGISILAVDGELFSFGETFNGGPCPTDVKVSKEAAIEEGWRQIERLFNNVDWAKYRQEFTVKCAELKIVQPNVLLGQMVPYFSAKSRLAWKIIYELTKLDKDSVVAVDFKQRITIKIDAATKKFLGGDFTQ